MPNLKDVVAVVLVVILLASLGYWYIVLPEYLAEKKRRQRDIKKEVIGLFSWEVTALRLDNKAGGKPCKYHIYVRLWDNTVIKFEQVFNSHTQFYAWVGGMYCNSLEKIDRIDYSREVLDA